VPRRVPERRFAAARGSPMMAAWAAGRAGGPGHHPHPSAVRRRGPPRAVPQLIVGGNHDRVSTGESPRSQVDPAGLHGGRRHVRLPQALSGEEARRAGHDGLPDDARGKRPQDGPAGREGSHQLRLLRRVRRSLPGPAPLRGQGPRLPRPRPPAERRDQDRRRDRGLHAPHGRHDGGERHGRLRARAGLGADGRGEDLDRELLHRLRGVQGLRDAAGAELRLLLRADGPALPGDVQGGRAGARRDRGEEPRLRVPLAVLPAAGAAPSTRC
jgi:hypothetical protein